MSNSNLIRAIKILGYSKQVIGTISIIEEGYLLCPREATLEDLDELGKLKELMDKNLSDVALKDIQDKTNEFTSELIK